MASSRTMLDKELPEGNKFTPAEDKLIAEVGGVVNQAQMIKDIYAIKTDRMLIDSNENLAKANDRHAKAQNIMTAVLTIATVVLAGATILLVIATNNLAP